jgi:hypothetical protein
MACAGFRNCVRNIAEVRRVADHQVPLLGRRNAVEIVGVIHCNLIFKSVFRHRTPACFDCLRIDFGETQCVAKAMAEQSEADETRTRTSFEYARLTRHAEIAAQQQVFPA